MKENERERIIACAKKSTFRSDFDDAYVDKTASNDVTAVMDTTAEVNVDNNDAEAVQADFEDVDSESDDDVIGVRVAKNDVATKTEGDANASVNVDDFGKFCVGMVMRHRKYNYFCVVYGWDPICKASKVGLGFIF